MQHWESCSSLRVEFTRLNKNALKLISESSTLFLQKKKRKNTVSLYLSSSFIYILQQDKKKCHVSPCSVHTVFIGCSCSVHCQNWATVRVNRPRGELISPPAWVSMHNPILLSNEPLLIHQVSNRSNISD